MKKRTGEKTERVAWWSALAGLSLLAGHAAAQMPAPPVFSTNEPRLETPVPVRPVETEAPVPSAVAETPAATGPEDAPPLPPPSSVRDPFWPVGYTPLPPSTDPDPTTGNARSVGPGVVVTPPKPLPPIDQWAEARAALTIQGISRMGVGGDKAFINGRFVGEGDTIEQILNGARYRWRVSAIGERAIDLQQLDAVRLEKGSPAP